MYKKFIIMITIIISMMTYSGKVLADVTFTKQPKGGTVDVKTDFTITWATNSNECQYMLQMRNGPTYDWGNTDFVTSPHKENYSNPFKSDYRIMAICGDNEYYSNSITISWKEPSNITTASMNNIEIGDLPLGYNNSKTYPISITNTGKYDIISPKLEFGEGYDYCEIIQNKTPHNIKPGETDNTTWSIKPKKGLGIGRYDTYVYLNAKNVASGISSSILFWVVESNVALTYEASASTIDFGTLKKGYSKQEDKNLVIKSTGTGNLSHVHITRGESSTTFFDVQTNNGTLDTLQAGTDSGKNWSIKLRTGLEPGTYSEQIKIYADELKNPALVTIKVKVTDTVKETTTVPKTPTKEPTTKETTTTTIKEETKTPTTVTKEVEEPIEEQLEEPPKEVEDVIVEKNETKNEKKSNIKAIIISLVSIIIVLVGTLTYILIRKRKNTNI